MTRPLHRFAHRAMRTGFELALADDMDAASARAIAQEVWALVDDIERALTAFSSQSDIGRINHSAGGKPVAVDGRTLRFINKARALHSATQGACDPTVGPMMVLLRGESPCRREALAEAHALCGMATQVIVQDGCVGLRDPGARLDPGALGKGFALQEVMGLLAEHEIANALIHGGTSSVSALGSAPGRDDGWPVAIASEGNPNAQGPVAIVCNNHLSVSSQSGRALRWPDGQVGHVINPTDATPAQGATLAAVLTGDAMVAEAWSTALLVGGPHLLAALGQSQHKARVWLAVGNQPPRPAPLPIPPTSG